MASIDEIRAARLKKLETLRERGLDPYPIDSHYDKTLREVVDSFKEGERLTLVGRILALRGQGKIIFFDFDDGTHRFQGLLKKGEPTKVEDFEIFEECFDIGDFIEVEGTLFLTKQNEKTILVERLRMLAKSLRPLPEKWHGLTDTEERFRKRYLDLLSNTETRERFIVRAKLVSEIRRFLEEAGFIETETPALQPLYGGASAEPFVTHHNALDVDLYLRISDELYLKRLLVGGYPRVYEIARDFRNEGIDTTHNPEFTMLEFYEAYSDAPKQMKFVEDLMKSAGRAVGNDIFDKKFEILTYSDALHKYADIKDPLTKEVRELRELAQKLGADIDPESSRVKLLDAIFKKAVKPELKNPTFIIDYPKDYLPLTKEKKNDPDLVDAFQLYAGGLELVKAFSELNDPLEQRKRFEKQMEAMKTERDAQPLDEEFLEAMEYGMPPAGGVGIGIDRLSMLLTGVGNIKEVILFPTLRPR